MGTILLIQNPTSSFYERNTRYKIEFWWYFFSHYEKGPIASKELTIIKYGHYYNNPFSQYLLCLYMAPLFWKDLLLPECLSNVPQAVNQKLYGSLYTTASA